MSCWSGFGNLLDGKHPIWTSDFTGAGHTQVLFYYQGDGNWWLGDAFSGTMQWSLVGNTAGFGNLLDGRHPIWIGDFTGVHRAQVLFYYQGDGNWWLGDITGGQMHWSLVGNTAGFGNLLDGRHPIWLGDFTGVGRLQVLFYYQGDGNWWLGNITGGQMHWSLVSNTAGFGNLLDGSHPIWIGDFTGAHRMQVLFYYRGDGNWWLGDITGGAMHWSLVSNTAGFGNLLDGRHPMWLGDFTGVGRLQVLFYYQGDGNWWLGDITGGAMHWSLVSNTAGFGNLLDGRHPMWLGHFTGANRLQVLFYYQGDGNWWLGDITGGQMHWSAVSNTAGFGNLLDGNHPMWLGNWTGAGRTQVLFFYSGDGNWWLGDITGGQMHWTAVARGVLFGNLLDGRHPAWIGDFRGRGRSELMFYYSGDGNWWLGDIAGAGMSWSRIGNTGREHGHRMRLLIKQLIAPTISIDTMLANMRTVYDTADILVDEGPRENLVVRNASGTTQLDFNVAPCSLGQPATTDQTLLFANRNNAGANDVVVYLVRSTIPPLNGCGAFPAGSPGAVVAQSASPWTMAHEVGHVLGLSHLSTEAGGGTSCSTPDFTRLMTGCGTGNITGTPTLASGEISTMQGSSFTSRC